MSKDLFKIDFGIEGLQEMLDTLERLPIEALEALEQAQVENAEHLIGESKKECPVDTGRLRKSGTVGKPVRRVNEVEIEVGYGTDYAIYVHERTELRHDIESEATVRRRLKRARAASKKRYEKKVAEAKAQGLKKPKRKKYAPSKRMLERRPKFGQKAKFLEDPLKRNVIYYKRRNEAALARYFESVRPRKGGPEGGSTTAD